MMDLRKEFEKETGRKENDFINFDEEYIEWLQSQLTASRKREAELVEELECSSRIWGHLMKSLQWLEDNGGGIDHWIQNQRDVIEARIKCNQTALRSAGQETGGE